MALTKSPKEEALDRRLLELVPESIADLADQMLHDEEIKALQDYANSVSIKRLGYNDHGPVHMRIVTKNALKFANLLKDAGIPMSLEKEGIAGFDDSAFALFAAGLLHDIGMSMTRQDHENYSVTLGRPIVERYLAIRYPGDPVMQVTMRSLIFESIVGHMAMVRIHSLEAGLLLAADGCDMEKGRARIPMLINTDARLGDIHKYSSSAVDRVLIGPGSERPISIEVRMSEAVGFFQVEEVLYPKLNVSPAKPYIELYAQIGEEERKRYL